MKKIIQDLSQKRIFRVATVYSVVAWLLMQVFDIVLPTFNAPAWVQQTLLLVLLLGLPAVIVISWVLGVNENGGSNNGENNKAGFGSLLMPVGANLNSFVFGFIFFAVLFLLGDRIFQGSDFDRVNLSSEPSLYSEPLHFRIDLGETNGRGNAGSPTDFDVSPNGEYLVYIVVNRPIITMYLKSLNTFEEANEIHSMPMGSSGNPVFSSDGAWIYFHEEGGISRIRVEGGSAQEIIPAGTLLRGISVFDEDFFYINSDRQLQRTNLRTNVTEVFFEEHEFAWPYHLPGGNNLLVTKLNGNDFSNASIEVIDLDNREIHPVVSSGFSAKFADSGQLVFARENSLWVQPFNLLTLGVTGVAEPILFDLFTNIRFGTASYDFSSTGRLLYLNEVEAEEGFLGDGTPVWVSRTGEPNFIDPELSVHGHPRLSPDENSVALMVNEGNGFSDIWVYDFSTSNFSRKTFDGSAAVGIWSPDGERLFTNDSRANVIWSLSASGAGSPIETFPTRGMPLSFSPNANAMIYGRGTPTKMYLASPENERLITELDLSPEGSTASQGRISPDGNWLAYNSNESGKFEIYVRPFPNVMEGKWQISTGGGVNPIWNKGASEIFYWNPNNDGIYKVSYSKNLNYLDNREVQYLSFLEPDFLFESEFRPDPVGPWDYSASRDQFIFISTRREDTDNERAILARQTRLNAIENWFSVISERVDQSN
ncbi:MAG: hypothetical protein P8N40_06805 [Gammaproteobacteria bacterium]|nr:hypothetical protein [Gammaproteobacteria bacterium]